MENNLDKVFSRFSDKWSKNIETGKGWYSIIIELNEELVKIDPNYKIYYIKEKFGGLRFNCSLHNDKATKLIDKARNKADITCEKCGSNGTERSVCGWICILCNNCYGDR